MKKPESMLRPLTELTLASVFWGFGFVATVWALQFLSFPAVIFYRFFGAFFFGAIFLLWSKPSWKEIKHELELSRILGFWLAFTLILQTWGLITTSPGKSAFITVLYVVFVPGLAALLDKEKLSLRNTFCLILALIGTGLIVNLEMSALTLGDLLTLGNALTAAVHIRLMGKVAPRSRRHFTLNTLQCFWTALFVSPLLILQWAHPTLFHGNWDLLALDSNAWIGILSLTFGSSMLAFFLQVRAQEKLSSTVAALLFLMESPFSAIFAAWLLHERMSALQISGAVLIFVACVSASLPEKLAPGAHP